MEGDGTELPSEKERLTEKACLVSTSDPMSILKPGKIDECNNNQANQQLTSASIAVTKSPTQENHTSCDIKVTLENESVWRRFHSLGTEMILTKQGRRMFPCCRFRLGGLDLQRKYFLVMDIMPLDEFTHKWNGNTWEPVALDVPHVPHVLGQICVHPDSPALGQQWMDSPVSFYKVKLTSDSIDQEGCVLLRPMHRYQPRLHVVPVDPDSEETVSLGSPNVKIFRFPQTEFYAVTSYQNAQITQLKIDCNPFAMAFREDSQSIHLVQNKLRLCSSVGTRFQSSLLTLARNLSEKRKEGAEKSTTSTSIQDNRVKCLYPGSASVKEGEGIFAKMRNATLSCPDDMDLCQENTDYSESDKGSTAVVNDKPVDPVLNEHVAPLDFEPSVTVSLDEPLPSTDGTVPPISGTENLKSSEDAVNSQIRCTNFESPIQSSMAAQSHGEVKSAGVSLPRPPVFTGSQVHERKPDYLLRHRHCHRGRKARSKWWSNVKYARTRPAAVPLNVNSEPDLEDVEGMLFVSFVAKEALNVHVENIKENETSLHPPSSTRDQLESHEAKDVSLSVEERIAKLEKMLLLHLKQLKHRQVIHPRLQDVGMKLSLLDPKLPIDLQYLGVHLPISSPIHEDLDKMNPMSRSSSPDAADFFVSRTGKTNDPTKIKGWRDKFKTSAGHSAPEGLKNSSAFCSEMLDAYLENEAQQISDRVAVFSKCSAAPVSYQLPSKSSSYVVTLDSLLKTRSSSSNTANRLQQTVFSKPTDKILPNSPLRRSPSAAVPLSSAGFQHRFQGNQEKGGKIAHSFEAHRNAVSKDHASRSLSFLSSPEKKTQTGKSHLSLNNSAGTASHSSVCSPVVRIKAKKQIMLQEMEEEAIFHGKVRTHITTKRAKFALTSLLNFQKSAKRPRFHKHHKDENECPQDFCHLGCVCSSLGREIRGPTHCRRVECMFDCNCFKHKVLLLHPRKETANVQRGRKRSVLAFPIEDPERQPRPPPAPTITTLWKSTTGEHDPEPLFIPAPPISPKTVSRSRTSLTHSPSQTREEDKDPVYLYFESMMTCARVREYNSNPPPQIHMFPTKKITKEPEELNEAAEASEPPSSQIPETNPTETLIKAGKPKPTKLLEILSECNWEPHRSLVLSALFRRMNSNLLSEPFYFGMYKIQLLCTIFKRGDRSSTVTYKVRISRADQNELTEDMQAHVKKPTKKQSLNGFKTNEKHAQKAKVATDSRQRTRTLLGKHQKKTDCKRLLSGLPFTHAAVGYLKADKKKPGSHPQCLIKVHGKTYSQAKLLLGQLGALHPVNHFAAFVTGRLLPVSRDQPKIEDDITKACPPKTPLEPSSVTEVTSNLAVARPPFVPESNIASKNRKSNRSPLNALSNLAKHTASLKEGVSIIPPGPPPGRTPIVHDGSRFVLVPVIPFNSAAAPSAETVTSSTLPSGQQVVLQPAQGMPGSKYLCQYNGQMIQLKPINPDPLVQPQPSSVSEGTASQVMQTAYNTCPPKDTTSPQTPLNSAPLTKSLPKSFSSVIAPKVLSLSAKSGMNIANGMPAFNLQSSFPGKMGTFSFRICPPTSEGKPVGSEHNGKPPEPSVDRSSTLILPGGFTLIKLLHPAVTSVPAVPSDVTSAASHSAKIPQNDESMRKSSCSPSLEQNCQVSGSISNPLLPETSHCDSAQGPTAGLSQNSDDFPSEDVINDEPVEHFSESVNTVTPGKYDWIPEGVEMVHTSDVSELKPNDIDDWPPRGAERILWIESGDEEENEDLNKEMNKNLDVASGSPAAEEARESKTSTTGTDKVDFSGCDDCLHADELYINEKETPNSPCSESSHRIEQKQHLQSSIPNNDEEKACDPYVNETNSSTVNISIQEPPFPVLINSPNIREQVIKISSPVKNEPHNESAETDMAGNEPDINNKGVLPENSPVNISKVGPFNSQTGENTLHKLFHIRDKRLGSTNNYSFSNKIESCHDSPKANTCSMNDDVTREFENTDIVGNAPCSLLNGQTAVMNSPPAEHLLNTASLGQTFLLKKGSPFPHNMHKSTPELSDDFDREKEAEDRNKQLMSNTAVEELCGDEEITVDVMNLSEDEDASAEFDTNEDSSSDDGEGDSSSDEKDSSDYSTSDSETTYDTTDMSNEDPVDIESFEENDGKRIINTMKNKTKQKKNKKRAAKLKKKIGHLSRIISTAGYLPIHELAKRRSHTEKERIRRDEMRQSFAALKKALNVGERVIMCRHDILNQARSMILALEDRSKCLEERKKALFQRRTAHLRKIEELSEKTEARDKACFENQKQLRSQKTLQTSVPGPPVNPRRLDYDGNRLPPRFGRWKAPNYIRKKSKTSLRQPSFTTTEKQSLPKIVLQSFGKTDATKLTPEVRTSLPGSTEVSNSAELIKDGNLDLQGQNKGMEICTATRVCNEMEKTLVSEHPNKESPTPSSAVTESDVQNNTMSSNTKDKQTTAAVEKVRKKRRKTDVVIDEALTNPDVLGPRQLRQRSPAVNGGATRGGSANKKRRII